MIIIGLTGSIGMGKSQTAQFFKEFGVPVYDADAAVHELYKVGGAAVPLIAQAFGDGVIAEGAVDRQKLSKKVLNDKAALKKLESIVHPLIGKDRTEAVAKAKAVGADIMVFDAPLLFETGGNTHVDFVVVVSAPYEVQKQRVLERVDMSEEKFKSILEKQIPDGDKRKRADFIVETDKGFDAARSDVKTIIDTILKNQSTN